VHEQTVLIVDDEKDILEEYSGLFEEYPVKVITNNNPVAAVNLLKNGNVTVLITDQRMPQMTGLELLEKAKEVSGDTIRMILTGFADRETMLDAINKGQVFRFLVKPCKPEEFVNAVLDALDYYRERERAREMIDSRSTYKDAQSDLEVIQTQLQEREAEIQMLLAENDKLAAAQKENFKIYFSFLISVLRLKNPELFRNGQWVAEFAMKIAKMLGLSDQEQNIVRIAGYVKNIGLILLPDILTEKPLGMFNADELKRYYQFPAIGQQLLAKLPGFSRVATTIGYQLEHEDGSGPRGVEGPRIPLLSKIIRVADDTYRILFVRRNDSERETIYGRTFMINHLRKNMRKLYDTKVATAVIRILEKGG
jgi:response regulator RpfG family c-di-GMP phosphodiesterase